MKNIFLYLYNYFVKDNGKIEKKDSVFVERMRLQIKQNLVLKIRNVHICYERKSPDKLGHPFSFGITLHYLELTVRSSLLLVLSE